MAWVSATKQASHTHKLSTAWVSATKQASHTHKLFIVWVSATKQASHTHKLFTAWVSATKQASHTHKLFSVWVSAAKQASDTHKLFTLRRKKGTGGRKCVAKGAPHYWQFSAMSHAIHKIVSKKRCQSHFSSRRSPHRQK